jgi:hypothetical protein
MLKILYFAGLRETLGKTSEYLALPERVGTRRSAACPSRRARRRLGGAGQDQEPAHRGEPADGRDGRAVE